MALTTTCYTGDNGLNLSTASESMSVSQRRSVVAHQLLQNINTQQERIIPVLVNGPRLNDRKPNALR